MKDFVPIQIPQSQFIKACDRNDVLCGGLGNGHRSRNFRQLKSTFFTRLQVGDDQFVFRHPDCCD